MVESKEQLEAEKKLIRDRLKAEGKDSAPNSDLEETEQEREEREQKEEKVIKYDILGGERCPVTAQDQALVYSMHYRIGKLENLEVATELEVLELRKNLIKKIEGLEQNTKLEELELYDNRIKKMENLSHLTSLRILDLSFNRIGAIEGIEPLVNL